MQPSKSLFNSGVSTGQFCAEYWQKKPFLFRQAFAREALSIGSAELFDFAQTQLPARIVSQQGGHWQLRSGPFKARDFKALQAQGDAWTLLVQDLNTATSAAADLLRQFRFLPDARLDDLMASYAVDGAGVGPHFDSYDVFLLQARGTRRWSIGPLPTPASRALKDDEPLKILKRFKPTETYELGEGDMLYLPPGYAHDGIAVGPCVTYSIGFRAPSAAELIARLYEDMAQAVRGDPRFATLYSDANLKPQQDAARLSPELLKFVQTHLKDAAASDEFLENSIATYLTEPKPSLFFDSDEDASLEFDAISLSRKSKVLIGNKSLYLNGESFELGAADLKWWLRFCEQHSADAALLARASQATRALLEEGLEAGWFEAKGRT